MKTNQRSFITVTVGVLTIVAGMMGAAHAQVVWDGEADPIRNWTTDSNWVGDTAPASGDDVQFSSTGNGVVQVDTAVTVGSIRFLAENYTLQGSQITIDPSLQTPTNKYNTYDIYFGGSAANSTQIDSALQLQGNVRFSGNTQDDPIINGVISDGTTAGSITYRGDTRARHLSLRGANTYSGGTTVSNITLELGDNSALGTGTWTLESDNDGDATKEPTYVYLTKDIALNNAVSMKGDMILGRFSPANGTLTLNGPISIDAAGVNIEEFDGTINERLELRGAITDNGNGFTLDMSQNSQIMLNNGANNITGDVTWVAGGSGQDFNPDSAGSAVLAIGNDNALGTGSLRIEAGAFTGGMIIAEGADVVIDNDIVVAGAVRVGVGDPGDPAGNSVTLTGEFSSTGGSSLNGLVINAGSTLAATGTIAAGADAVNDEVKINPTATLAPGNTGNYGTLTIDGDLEFVNSDAIFQIDLKDAVAGTGHDQLILNGEVYLDKAQLSLNLDAAPVFNNSDLAFILVNDGTDPITGDFNSIFNGLSDGAIVNLGTVSGSPATAQISYFGDSVLGTSTGGNDIVLYNFDVAVIPEPSSVVLMLLGGIATVFVSRRRRSAKA